MCTQESEQRLQALRLIKVTPIVDLTYTDISIKGQMSLSNFMNLISFSNTMIVLSFAFPDSFTFQNLHQDLICQLCCSDLFKDFVNFYQGLRTWFQFWTLTV